MTFHPFSQMGHEGPRHRIGPPTPQERRVKRLLRIAGRAHARYAEGHDGFNQRAIELHGSQPETNRRGLS